MWYISTSAIIHVVMLCIKIHSIGKVLCLIAFYYILNSILKDQINIFTLIKLHPTPAKTFKKIYVSQSTRDHVPNKTWANYYVLKRSVLSPKAPWATLTSEVPNQMSLTWSQIALAADIALDSFLALITAAPRCWTV